MKKYLTFYCVFLYFMSCGVAETHTIVFSDKINQDSVCLTDEIYFDPGSLVYVNLRFSEPNPHEKIEGTIYDVSGNDKKYLGTTIFSQKGSKMIKYYIPFDRYNGQGEFLVVFRAGQDTLATKEVFLLPEDMR